MNARRLLIYGAIALGALAAVATACGVDDLNIEGKDCPCVVGFTCDITTNKCVRSLDGSGSADGEARDAPVGLFAITKFGPTWRTSRSIRWDWEVTGDSNAFAEYQIVVGGSEDAVRRQDSTTTTFDRRLAPELATFNGRESTPPGATTGKGWAVTDRLNLGRKTFARLIVRDKEGRENLSAVVSETTLTEDASTQTSIITDTLVDGSVLTPSNLVRVTSDCYGGSSGCFQVAKVDCSGDASCAFDIGMVSLDRKNVTGMTKPQFDNAFVELGVRGGASAHAKESPPFGDLVLTIGATNCTMPGGGKCRFRYYKGWSFRPGQKDFRLVQVPLKMLQLETPEGPGSALTFEDLNANALRIEGLTITGQWSNGANIGIDNGFIRW